MSIGTIAATELLVAAMAACSGKKCGSAEKSPPYSQGDVIYWG